MKIIIYGHFVFKESDDPYPELTREMIKYAKFLLHKIYGIRIREEEEEEVG